MGFFDKMFEKKECAICGTELGLLGKTKISEGYLCKECAGKLSPYFHGYRSSTADDIREQLAYREANAERLSSFNPTRTLSAGRTNIMLDEDAGLLIITSQSRWRDANPDIIEFSQVLGCDMDIDEHRTEIYRETKDGERESYNPPRYDLDYDFNLTIHVNTPYFTEINLRVNDSTIDQRGSIEYREAKRQATEVRDALVQLRQENETATLYNLVGFQTNLKWGEQKRVFSMIPGLEHAEFVRYGVMHRNTFLDAPRVLSAGLCLKEHPNVFFAGQITGFEGYMESAACGLLAARNLYARLEGRELPPPPADTMCGALVQYLTTENKNFQPMGANMGILPPLPEDKRPRDKRLRYMAQAERAVASFQQWLDETAL